MTSVRRLGSAVVLAALAGACAHGPTSQAPAGPAPDAELDGAIAALKGVEPGRLSDEQLHAKNAELDRAWRTLEAHRERAIVLVERALRDLRASGRRDDVFAIEASGVLWHMAGVDAAGEIAVALEGVDLGARFQVAFSMLAAAARTRDPRVVPILRYALVTDEKTGTANFAEHFLTVAWPDTLAFMVAPFGPSLCEQMPLPALPPSDERAALSLLYLADTMACASAQPAIRRWAHEAKGRVGEQAALALSHLGAPEDRDWFISLAASPDGKTRWRSAYLLYEHGDPASAPTLRRLLTDADQQVRLEAVAGVFHLIDAEGGRALMDSCRAAAPSSPEREKIDGMLAEFARETGVERASLEGGARAAWEPAVQAYWKKRDTLFALRPGDRKLDRPELLRALAHWGEAGSLSPEEHDWTSWIESRHVLSIAEPGDVPRLVSVRSAILRRQNDEIAEELKVVDRMIGVLRRRAAGAAKANE
jgi:HEAT repeat protein